jgi:cyclase
VGLVVTEAGGLLIDTPMLPPEARQWRWRLEQLGVAELYGIVNTDYHPEHFFGNAAFMPVRTWGHELSAKPITKYKPALLEQIANAYRADDPQLADELASVEIHPPELCVGDRMTLHLGERRVEVLYLDGHTPASLGVYLPEERILFAGDNIVNNEHPVMVQANSLAWIETLDRIREMPVDLLVPGIGEPCGKDVIEPLQEYIREMRARVGELYAKGASRRECVDKSGMLEYYPVPEHQTAQIKKRRRESVERVYAEIRILHPRSRR